MELTEDDENNLSEMENEFGGGTQRRMGPGELGRILRLLKCN